MIGEYNKRGWTTTIGRDEANGFPVLVTHGKYEGKINSLYATPLIGNRESVNITVVDLPQSQQAVIEFLVFPKPRTGKLGVRVKYELIGSDEPGPMTRKSTEGSATVLSPGMKTDIRSPQELEAIGQIISAPLFPGFLPEMFQQVRGMYQALEDQLHISRNIPIPEFNDSVYLFPQKTLTYYNGSLLHHTSFAVREPLKYDGKQLSLQGSWEYKLPLSLSNRRAILYLIKEEYPNPTNPEESSLIYCLQQVIDLPKIVKENIARYYQIDGSLEPESKPLAADVLGMHVFASSDPLFRL